MRGGLEDYSQVKEDLCAAVSPDFRAVLDASLAGVSVLQDGQRILVNRMFCTLTGYSEEELATLPPYESLVAPEARDEYLAKVELIRTGQPVKPFKTTLLCKDRSRRVVITWGQKITFRERPAIVGTMVDLCDYEAVQQHLVRGFQQYQLIVEHAGTPILLCDEEGRVFFMNTQARRDWQELAEGESEFRLCDIFSAERSARCRQVLRDVFALGMPIMGHGRRQDGNKERCYQFRIMPMEHWETGQPCALVIAEDITHEHQARKLAEQRQQQLLQADKLASLGTLVAGVAHEINNPNHFIMINSSLLGGMCNDLLSVLDGVVEERGNFKLGSSTYTELRDDLPKLLEGILEGSHRIRRIVESLQDFSRKESDNMQETVDLNTAVETAVTLCRNLLKRSTRHFSVHSAKDPLPCVTGNRQQLEQVIVNLLQNACLALSDRDQCIEVTLSCDAVGQLVQLRVRDEGCGMTPDVLERVMDPFFTTRQTAGGTGMGLSISKSIVRKHGGRLAFESEPGRGTSVRLTLPVDPCCRLDQGGVYEP